MAWPNLISVFARRGGGWPPPPVRAGGGGGDHGRAADLVVDLDRVVGGVVAAGVARAVPLGHGHLALAVELEPVLRAAVRVPQQVPAPDEPGLVGCPDRRRREQQEREEGERDGQAPPRHARCRKRRRRSTCWE